MMRTVTAARSEGTDRDQPARRLLSLRIAGGSISTRVSRRVSAAVVLATLALVAAALWAITQGTVDVSLDRIVDAARGRGDRLEVLAIRDVRLPRVLNGVLAGFALGLSGAIFQALFRNGLASPDVLGVTSGAALGAFVTLRITGGLALLGPGALIGGITAAVVVYLLAHKRGAVGRDRVVLVGVAVSAICIALLGYLLTALPPAIATAAARWQVGTLTGSSWDDVRNIGATCLIATPIVLVLHRRLLVLQFGEEFAIAAGVQTRTSQLLLGGLAVLLATSAVASSGPITFVALISPHLARMLTRRASGGTFILSGLIGAWLVVVADWAALNLSPFPIPVGIVTAAIGAPFFLYLLVRGGNSA